MSILCNQNYLFTMNDDEFDVLVSTADFLKIEARCRDLEQENQKMLKEKEEMDLNLLEMSAKNADQSRKIKRLQDNNKYLSLQGIKIAKTVLESSKNHSSAQQVEAQVQTEIQFRGKCQSCQRLKRSQQKIATEYQKSQQRNKNQQNELNQKYELIKLELETVLQKNNQSKLNLQDALKKNELLKKQNEDLLACMHELQLTNGLLNQKAYQLQIKLKCMENQINGLNQDSQKTHNKCQNLTNEVSALRQTVRQFQEGRQGSGIWKMPKYVEASLLEDARQEINSYIVTLQGLNKQLLKLEQVIKEKDEILTFYSEQQKKLNLRIDQLCVELKRFKPAKIKETNQMEELRIKLDQFFTNFAFKLCDSGGMKPQQIEKNLKTQQLALRKLMEDIVQSIKSNIIPKKKKNCFSYLPIPI